MRKRREQGEGKLGAIIWLAIFATVLYAGWNVGPVYIGNYALNDKMNEIARSPRGMVKDDKILDLLMKYVREERLSDYINRSQFKISTMETNRRISCEYERTVEILPGWKHRFVFRNQADQPLIF